MKFWRQIPSIISLVIVNIIPIYGVIFYDWNVFTILLLYWAENVVIGFFTVLKIMKAEGVGISFDQALPQISIINQVKKSFFIPFFIMHYGLFTFVHGIFLFVMFFSTTANYLGILFSLISLWASHFISYQSNFIGKKEFQHISSEQLFIAPYPRIVVMHLTIILGAFLVLGMGQPVGALILLIVLKTIVDLISHLFEHRKIFKISLV